MSMNDWNGIGRLTKDPELRTTPNGVSVCSFSIAVDRDYADKDTKEREVDFFDIVAWRNTAEFVHKYFSKGRMIGVNGRLQNRTWEDKQGNKRRTTEIRAEHCYFCGDKPKDRTDEEYVNQDAGYDGFARLTDDDIPF